MKVVCMPGAVQEKYKLFHEYIDAGFSCAMLDLMEFCSEYAIENREEIFDKRLANLDERATELERTFLPMEPEKLGFVTSFFVQECRRRKIDIAIGRAPALPYDSKRNDSDALMRELVQESIHVCELAGCEYLIVYPLIRQMKSAEDMEKNKEFYRDILKMAKEKPVTILLQNSFELRDGNMVRGKMADPYVLRNLVDELNADCGQEKVGVCLDIGVCNLLGQNVYELIKILGQKVKAAVFSENDGVTESYMIPFTSVMNKLSKMDWLNVIRGLRSIRFDGPIICNYIDSQSAVSHLIRPYLIQYEKKITDLLVWQLSIENAIKKYSSRVLFGAGNMCRNYMKCYGEEFPPLYTCDNNEKIWGTTFEGLEIKNPEELKKLPQDCAIFICNIYYDEIEKQLREMGITNPIERFNDEYLPSMYTDRFDANKREVRK